VTANDDRTTQITALRNNFYKHLICRDFSEIFLVYELARLVVRGAPVVVGGELSQPGVIRRPALETKKPPCKAAISESGISKKPITTMKGLVI
jgi:hypothetical protein